MSIKRLILVAALAVAGGLIPARFAEAHTPSVTVNCRGIAVSGSNYGSTDTLTLTVNGVTQGPIAAGADGAFSLDALFTTFGANTWSYAFNATNNAYDLSNSGTTTGCGGTTTTTTTTSSTSTTTSSTSTTTTEPGTTTTTTEPGTTTTTEGGTTTTEPGTTTTEPGATTSSSVPQGSLFGIGGAAADCPEGGPIINISFGPRSDLNGQVGTLVIRDSFGDIVATYELTFIANSVQQVFYPDTTDDVVLTYTLGSETASAEVAYPNEGECTVSTTTTTDPGVTTTSVGGATSTTAPPGEATSTTIPTTTIPRTPQELPPTR